MRTLLASLLTTMASAAWAGTAIEINRPDFRCVGGADSVRLPSTLSGLRSIGKLLGEETVRVEEWDGYKAIEKSLRFNGLSIQVITFTNNPERYSLGAVYLESPAWSLGPYRVGQSSALLAKSLGTREFSPSAVLRLNGESESLQIESRAGKVHRIVYECYTG